MRHIKYLYKYFIITLFLSMVLLGCSQESPLGNNTEQNQTKDNNKSDKVVRLAGVNNPQSKQLEKLSEKFTEETGIEIKFNLVPENDLRQLLTNQASQGTSQYDVIQIGAYEASFWSQYGWIENLEPFFDGMSDEEKKQFDRNDILKPIMDSLSYNGDAYALPFFGESSMVFYNKKIMEENNIDFPEHPTWTEIYDIAKKVHSPENNLYGITMRGQPGWGVNGAVFGTMINAFGARWFDENWEAQFINDPDMKRAWEMYKNLLVDAGQPGILTTGPNEAAQLFMDGKAAIMYDSSAWPQELESNESAIAGNIGYASSPTDKMKEGTGWLWNWSLAMSTNAENKKEAFEFMTWVSSKDYTELVAEDTGWATVPPGIRESTYNNPKYIEAAPFSEIVLENILSIDPDDPALKPTPYSGVQFIAIPEFSNFGNVVAESLASYTVGEISLDEALQKSQDAANQAIIEGGYRD